MWIHRYMLVDYYIYIYIYILYVSQECDINDEDVQI